MIDNPLFQEVRQLLEPHFSAEVDESSRKRITLLVLGIIGSESASPAKIAETIKVLKLTDAKIDSIERQIRRIENDLEITDVLCFHKFAREHLILGNTR
jgi:hypothetical protein